MYTVIIKSNPMQRVTFENIETAHKLATAINELGGHAVIETKCDYKKHIMSRFTRRD